MKTKICGLTNQRCSAMHRSKSRLFRICILWESPRNVNISDINVLSKYNKKKSAFVAVTVNVSDKFIKKNILGNFDFIQLHGSETKDRVTSYQEHGFKSNQKQLKLKRKKI